MPSIGYTNTESLSKLDIAICQLNDAISLFVNERFISALTLAGAAEGVLSGLLKATGEECVRESSIQMIKGFRERLDLDPKIDNMSKEDFYNYWNNNRNRVKHHNKNESELLSINPCDAAYWEICGALANAKKLNVDVPKANEFRNWVSHNATL